MKILAPLLYLIAAIGCLIGRLLENPLSTQLDYIFKPLLMPLLALIVLTSPNKTYPNKLLLLFALLFAWGGDMALMLGRDGLLFLAGLGSFLVMQILYIILFRKDWERPSFLKKKPYWMLPFLVVGSRFYLLSIPKLTEKPLMLIAVFVYAVALVSMSLSALNRKGTVAWNKVLIGAILFLISDLMIGASKFILDDFPYSGFAIMITYISGQYLIVSGLLKNKA